MSKTEPTTSDSTTPAKRRQFTDEFKRDAVNMLLDGHSAQSICECLGLSSPTLLYRWKRKLIGREGTPAATLDGRVRELEAELKRTQRERDVSKKALAIFSRNE